MSCIFCRWERAGWCSFNRAKAAELCGEFRPRLVPPVVGAEEAYCTPCDKGEFWLSQFCGFSWDGFFHAVPFCPDCPFVRG